MTKMMASVEVELANVASVYSGKNGKCCCGCSGKHTYASAHVKWASKYRGYEVTEEEVNDKTVATMFAKVAAAGGKYRRTGGFAPHVEAVVGDRLYVVYLKE